MKNGTGLAIAGIWIGTGVISANFPDSRVIGAACGLTILVLVYELFFTA